MPDLILNNKPLVEAIFELRWQLLDEPNGYIYDPHYKLLVGQVYEKIKHIYPFHQTLPQASMPDEISAYIVQHRFRIEENKWPLMQIGPGIITLNETQSYHWDDFKKRIADLIDTIFSIYPSNNSGLKPNGLLLRYINAIDFNFGENDIFAFFKDQLKTNITFHESLFHETGVKNQPYGFDFKFTFCNAPHLASFF